MGPRARRRRTLVRGGLLVIVAAIAWATITAIDTQPDGWVWLVGTVIAVLWILTVVVIRADASQRR